MYDGWGTQTRGNKYVIHWGKISTMEQDKAVCTLGSVGVGVWPCRIVGEGRSVTKVGTFAEM